MSRGGGGMAPGLADRALAAVGGAFKRVLFHGAALIVSALIATDAGIGLLSHSLAYFLCNYVGIVYLFPAEAAILPTALGLILGLIWLGMGYPFFMLPFWAGAYCFVQKSLNCGDVGKIGFISAGWLALCGFVNFYSSALAPSLWPAAALLPAGYALEAVWKKRQKKKEEEMDPIKSGSHVFGEEPSSGEAGQPAAPGHDPRYDMGWNTGPQARPEGPESRPPSAPAGRGMPGRFTRTDAGWEGFPAAKAPPPVHWREFHAQIEQLAARGAALDPDMRDSIAHIGRHARNILQCMAEDQRDVAPGERFLSRYLPAAVNVVESCARIPPDMPEADAIVKSTRDVLQRLEEAFKGMHANLIENDKIDARADLAVLDKLLKMQGH